MSEIATLRTVTDAEWASLQPIFPQPEKATRGKPATPCRAIINSLLYVLVGGMKWETIPQEGDLDASKRTFATKSVSNRCYRKWSQDGTLDKVVKELGIAPESLSHPPIRKRVARIQDIANKQLKKPITH